MNPRVHADKVALFGSLLGTAALLVSFAVGKPNRIAEGSALRIFDLQGSSTPYLAVLLLTCLLIGLILSIFRTAFRRELLGIIAPLVLVSTLVLLAASAGSVAEYDYGRVSPVGGFWLLLLSSVFLYDSAFRGADRRLRLRLFSKLLPPVMLVALFASGAYDHLAVVQEFGNRSGRFAAELSAHAALSFGAVGVATGIGVPLGLLAWRREKAERGIFSLVNGLQTIPSLALFGLMIAPLALLSQQYPFLREWGIRGIGNTPALIALSLYSLLPIVRNTYAGLAMIPDSVVDAGRGLGMAKLHMLRHVELPLSIPVVLGGIRVAAVLTVGNTAVAALIGAGGLGNFVFQGLGQAAPDLIVMGVLPIILMAVAVDRGFALLIRLVSPLHRGSVTA
jgi:osmoprotectant transport system permease protein